MPVQEKPGPVGPKLHRIEPLSTPHKFHVPDILQISENQSAPGLETPARVGC